MGLFGQDNLPSDWGHILAEDFHPKSPVVDSSVNVVVLADIGHAEIAGSITGWHVLFNRYRRMLIRNKKGYDAAKITLSFNPALDGNGKLASLRANIYNLEGGKVVQMSVDAADMYLDKREDGDLTERFTFPGVREGSIIEYTYNIHSGSIYSFHSWDFQGDYPRIKSEYSVTFPETFNYVISRQGPFPMVFSHDSVKQDLEVGSFSVKTMAHTLSWSMKDVPAVVDEPFVASMDNHVSGIRFQLSEYTVLNTGRRLKFLNSWRDLNANLLKDKAFGGVMTASTHFLRRELRTIVEDSVNDLDRAKAIYAYVRDHFTTSGRSLFSDDLTIKEIFKAGKGTQEEINLLLTAMLRDEGLKADAVMLSTRGNGLINPLYPLTLNFNYVVVRLRLGGKEYFLDATEPQLGFGKLPLACYNGYARVVSEKADSAFFSSDSLVESKFTSVLLYDNDAGDSVVGTYRESKGYYASLGVRDSVASGGEAAYFGELRRAYPFEVKLTDGRIDSLHSRDQPVMINYTLSFPLGEDRIYLNPMLSSAMKENPFSAMVRRYPVEMSYAYDQLFGLRMDIPKGYEIEELPKPAKIKLFETDGVYEYGFLVGSDYVQFRSRLVLKRT
jgi:Domain of Unknown Function with PDB structure (DUF3857)/Transglutaminase-like superfamily